MIEYSSVNVARRLRGRSVDRVALTPTRTFDHHAQSENAPRSRPPFRRRFSISAIPTAAAGVPDEASVAEAEYDLYGARPKPASQVRWSRKDIVYTAENMGFSQDGVHRHVGHLPSAHRSRAGSVTRFPDDELHPHDSRRRVKARASSLSRIEDGTTRSARTVGLRSPVPKRVYHPVPPRGAGADRTLPPSPYSSRNYTTAPSINAELASDGFDIASFVLAPGEQFFPTNVSVSVLPSGKKAVTYTRFSQKGSGDQQRANVEIDRIIQRTNRMQVISIIMS